MLKAVMFDLDDTLLWDQRSVKEAFEAVCRAAEEETGVEPEVLEKAVREEAQKLYASYDTYEFTKMIGINPFEGLWGDFLDDQEDFRRLSKIVPVYRETAWTLGLKTAGIESPEYGKILSDKFREERKKHPFVYEDTFEVLDQLKGRYKLLLLTNGSPELQQQKLAITPELTSYFDEIVISGDYGKGKPDPGIFVHALERLRITREEAVMVGDNLLTDILGASRAGIPSVWINRHGKTTQGAEPDYELASLRELLPLLGKLAK